MENNKKEPSKFQRDWQNHYPVIIIYLFLVIACVVVGKVTNWKFFGFLLYALLAVGLFYLLCFLPWYFTSLKKDSISSGVKTSTRGVSLILGVTSAFLLLYQTWGNWSLGENSSIITPLVNTANGSESISGSMDDSDYSDDPLDRYVRVSKSGKYHELNCRHARKDMQKMTCREAIELNKTPCKVCH